MPPKRKLKGKASAEPTGYDELTNAASYQEDQATRYQFGDKAQRHYEEAARLYALALQVTGTTQEEQYDARYNLGRIYYALATEIYGLPKCYEALSQAIQEYRACASYNISDKTDAAFNLAQALQTLGEYISEATSSSSILSTSSSEAVWLEARQILEEVRQDQLSRLARSSIPSTPDNDTFSDNGDVQGDDQGSTSGADAVEEQIMTPSTVIETIIAAIQADISIAETTGQLDINDVSSLLDQASTLNGGADGYMTNEINSTKHELLKTQARIQLEKGQAPNIEELQAVVAEQREAISASRRPDPAGLSDLADTLLLLAEVLLTSSQFTEIHAETPIKEAIALYEQARGILGSSFQRPSSTPAHHTSALISANWQSTANAFAILALISRASSSSSSTAADGDFRALIADARRSAGEALNSLEGPFKAQAPDASGITKFARTLRSAVRDDYRTVIATRDSVLAIARLFLLERLLLESKEPYGEQGRGMQALMKATWTDANDLKQAIDDYVGGFASDSIGRLCQKLGVSEQSEWSRFVQAS